MSIQTMIIRLFEPDDAEQIARLFHNTVRQINVRDYSPAQVKAWSPDNIYFRDWLNICSTRFTYVAEQNGKILGFGELKANGHIDCFYVHYQYQGRGVGKKIYRAMENKAIELNLPRLYTEASISAKSFFVRQGFVKLEKQQVICRGEKLINYLIEKRLIEQKKE